MTDQTTFTHLASALEDDIASVRARLSLEDSPAHPGELESFERIVTELRALADAVTRHYATLCRGPDDVAR